MSATLPRDDEEYRRWLTSNEGYVLNGDRARTKAHYPMLHKSNCHLVSSASRENFVDRAYYKVCAAATAPLLAWTRKEFARQPTRCGVCRP